ncbi:hypothetical protein C9001_24580, partial [Escherichia coli]
MLTCWQIEKSVFVKIRLLEWATGDSLLVSRELFQLRIYHLAGDYFMNRPGFPGECFICELRLPDHRFRWKH